MSNTPGAQAQASTHAFRNSPSDIDELRDNVADIAGSVGDMASHQSEQAYEVATDAVEETGQIIRRNPLASMRSRLRDWLPVGTYSDGRSRSPSLTALSPTFSRFTGEFPWHEHQRR